MKLTEEQTRIIHRYRELISEASSDLSDSLKTEYMSESKSSVYELMQEENFAGLPDEVARELARLAKAAWRTVAGTDSAYKRAARTCFNVGELERYTYWLLNPSAEPYERLEDHPGVSVHRPDREPQVHDQGVRAKVDQPDVSDLEKEETERDRVESEAAVRSKKGPSVAMPDIPYLRMMPRVPWWKESVPGYLLENIRWFFLALLLVWLLRWIVL